MPLFRRKFTPAGASPGVIADRDVDTDPSTFAVAIYNEQSLVDREFGSWDPGALSDRAGRVAWVDVRGLRDVDAIHSIGEQLGMHPLAVSDVINVGQRPKVDPYEGSLFIVVRSIATDDEGELAWEQVGIALNKDTVATFQEAPVDCLQPVRDRLRAGRQKLRASGSDYLACMVIDTVVDNYFPVLAKYGERLEEMEDRVLGGDDGTEVSELYELRRDLTSMHHSIWPLRDALSQLIRDPDSPISDETRPYLRDTADHAHQVLEVLDSFRDHAKGLVELHLAIVGQRTNEVMRTLTIVATIFIPLTFLSGVYGMNFDRSSALNQPELGWRYGYVAFWIVSAALTAILLAIFFRIGWLGSAREPGKPSAPRS
ncbi:magnesium/cobalt transporter CorA [Engelhardtia mirabilis]|uniref:Magnesium transport protein CorA n=1 Tax=Engelhardtia mirabilis TaxID=2528011 RepID=A0A518BLE4_9BACT|nr:Magnesium transport protein CorA [Planctomycetes bacterium Pla133]QDV02117.1 Magnesium transport protein CorA [Planctomycetes bacterium Pla86]